MHIIDWSIVALYLIASLALGLYFSKRAGTSTDAFFASGRQLHWLLAGVSMLATSFGSDTPLWITSLVRHYGVHYAWQYWSAGIGGALAVVLFARWWRRLGVLTDIEMIELRYGGRPAAALRGANAVLTGVLFCPLIIGWVTKAMEVITRETLGLPEETRVWTTLLVMAVALGSCALSGLWGVVYTDFFQFILAVIGTTALAVISIRHVGGMHSMLQQLSAADWAGHDLKISPRIGNAPGDMSLWNAVGYFGLLWMHVGFSGGFQAQRVLACKNARHASMAVLTLSIVYFAFLAWPWILTAMCSMLIIPTLGSGLSQDIAYPRMIMMMMPVGFKGLLITAMLAAFMSTISTLFNWGSSYFVNDFYQRFVVRDAGIKHYVNVGRISTVGMAAAGAWISFKAENILQLATIGFVMWAGIAMVGALRWLWWRVNATGELVATAGGYLLTGLIVVGKIFDRPMQHGLGERAFSSDPDLVGLRMVVIVGYMIASAVIVSLLTAPESDHRLLVFLRRARPFAFGWKRVVRRLDPEFQSPERVERTLVSWAIVLTAIYGLLFGTGWLLLGRPVAGCLAIVTGGVALWLTVMRLNFELGNEVDPESAREVLATEDEHRSISAA